MSKQVPCPFRVKASASKQSTFRKKVDRYSRLYTVEQEIGEGMTPKDRVLIKVVVDMSKVKRNEVSHG